MSKTISTTGCVRCRLSILPGQETTVCPECGAVHHWRCWQSHAGCSAPACPSHTTAALSVSAGDESRGTLANPSGEILSITDFDLDRAVPLRVQTPRRGVETGDARAPRATVTTSRKPWNGLAIASFITALAGLPLFGLATGLVAVVLGVMAVAALRSKRQRGIVLAALGVLLGVFDVVLWGAAIVYWLGPEMPAATALEEFEVDPEALKNLDPPLKRAMQANVLVESRSARGWLNSSGIGSGVILKLENQTAWILTNRHVIDHDFSDRTSAAARGDSLTGEIRVKLVGQPSQPATVLWTAPEGIDLAIIQAPAFSTEAQATRWEAGVEPRIGDAVFAVGNPQGLGWTHTQGTVSQFRLQPKGTRQIRLVQTSTAINPGNSGGGLYDQQGRLIGINTATVDKRVGEGLSFAIALETFLSFDVPFLHRDPNALPAEGP